MILYIMLLFFYSFWRMLRCFAHHETSIIINKILSHDFFSR